MRKVFVCVLVLMMLAVSVSATASFVTDASGILSQEQIDDLNEKLMVYHDDFGVSVGIVTTDSLDGQTIEDYAKSYYAEGGYSNDGALLVICENEGQWYIYTSGLCAELVSQDQMAQIGNVITGDLQAGTPAQAFNYFAEALAEPACQEIKAQEEKAQQIQKSQKTYVFLGLLAGLLAGVGISVLLWFRAKSMKPVNPENPVRPAKLPSPSRRVKPAAPQRRVRPPFPGEERKDENS